METLIQFTYPLISSLIIYLLTLLFLRKSQFRGKLYLKYNLLPVLIIILNFIFRWSNLIEIIYYKMVLSYSLYLLLFTFILSIFIQIKRARDERITCKNILLISIPVIVIALLHQFGVITIVLDFIRKPLFTISSTRISLLDIIIAVLIFFVVFKLSRNIKVLIESQLRKSTNLDRGRIHLITRIVRYSFIILGAFIALSIVGINLTTLKVLIGALGVGIGFGLQTIVNNLISGFILLSERSIIPGDLIEVDGLVAEIETVGLRATIVKTFDNIEVIIPNSDLVNKNVINLTHTDEVIRISVPIGVSYSSNPEKLRKILMEGLSDIEDTLDTPEYNVIFSGFGDSSLNFKILIWTDKPFKKIKIESDIRFLVFKILKDNNIEIPFPQMDVHIKEK